MKIVVAACPVLESSLASIITQDELICGMAEMGTENAIVDSIENGASPRDAIAQKGRKGASIKAVPLISIVGIKWKSPDTDIFLTVTYDLDGVRQSVDVFTQTSDVTTEFVELLTTATGKRFSLSQKRVSAWKQGITPLICAVIPMMYLVPTTWISFDPPPRIRNPANLPMFRNRRAEGLEMMARDLGPKGMITLTAVVLAGFLFWWWRRSLNRPIQYELTVES